MGQVISSVLQVSIFGHTLFLIYINDLCDNVKAKVRLFADDTTDTTRLQRGLDTLEKWKSKWQMSFNVSNAMFSPSLGNEHQS